MSRQLNSILDKIPSATITKNQDGTYGEKLQNLKQYEEMDRIVAAIPKALKEEIQQYVKSHKGETERTVVLKALKLLGFKVLEEWLVDKRSTR